MKNHIEQGFVFKELKPTLLKLYQFTIMMNREMNLLRDFGAIL